MVSNNFNQEVKDTLNKVLKAFFKANSVSDNIAYALDCELNCPAVSKLYHEGFAHVFLSDALADYLSRVMVREGVRPVRLGFDGDDDTYENIVVAFADNLKMVTGVKNEVLEAIAVLDYYKECKALVLALEDMLEALSAMVHQSDIWKQKAEDYFDTGDVKGFDKDFHAFSNFGF